MSRSRQILREFIGARNEVEYHKLQFNDASAIVTAGERALSQADNELIVAELKLKKAEDKKSSPIFIQSLQHELIEAEAAKSIAELDLFCMQRRLLPYRKELEKSEAAKESLENKMRFALKSVVVASVHEAEVAVSLGFGNNIFASTKMDSCDRNDLRREVRVKLGVSIRNGGIGKNVNGSNSSSLLVVGLFDSRWETTQSARAQLRLLHPYWTAFPATVVAKQPRKDSPSRASRYPLSSGDETLHRIENEAIQFGFGILSFMYSDFIQLPGLQVRIWCLKLQARSPLYCIPSNS